MPLIIFLVSFSQLSGQETLPPITNGNPPQNRSEVWAGFDPRSEPLETEILHEWEEDGVVLQVLRYRIGVFKGQKAMMAAVYGYPKGAKDLPGLVQIHGGGQYADYRAPLTNAKRGYATLSISWAGRINAPDYTVTPKEVKLFWDNKNNDPAYRVTTDWGALDGYHAPSRYDGAAFNGIQPADWTIDSIESPRNNPWFLSALGARRALTFLEQQPEVNPEKLGVYGHSMGGKLTVLTAGSDDRVKAAAPSCGGVSGRFDDNSLLRETLGDGAYLPNITVPIIFLSPSNDFHGRIHDLQTALKEIRSDEWRVTCSPHHNHQDNAAYEVATQLWFDEHLKDSFRWPKTPETTLALQTPNSIPALSVHPDLSSPVVSVEIYYTQDASPHKDHYGVIKRCWNYAHAEKKGDVWSAELPLSSDTRPLWVYANVKYDLEKSVRGAGYYYKIYSADQFNVSSPMHMVSTEALKQAEVFPTRQATLDIESFDEDWEKEWFTYKPEQWGIRTHKVNDPLLTAPEIAQISLEVSAEQENMLVIGMDSHASEVPLQGGNVWQRILLSPSDFKDARGDQLQGFHGVQELRLIDQETLRARRPDATRRVGVQWKGAAPSFRNIKWVTGGPSYLHPGISHTQSTLDFVKEKVEGKEEPWFTAFEKVISSSQAELGWEPQPHVHVERGPYNNPNIGSSDFSQDAKAAYTHALLWALTEKEAHAKKAAQIIDAWSVMLESISNHDARLLVGMEGYYFCNAAELLKHTWRGWPQDNQTQFESMLRGVFYPTIKDFYPSANGNWDASMLQTMLAMGVYLDDRSMFDRAIDYYLNGKGNGAVRHYFKPTGQCQETGRDQGHTQMGLDYLANTCEIAWSQGVDLYSAFDNRLLKGFEYTAKYNLGFAVPYEPYRSYQGRYHYKSISDKARGRLRPMYEKVLHHYQHRKGIETPFTEQAVMKLREDSSQQSRRRRSSSAPDTLMFAGQPAHSVDNSSWLIKGEEGWESDLEHQSGLTVEGDYIYPAEKSGSLRTRLLISNSKRKASSLVIKQSPVWQNWNLIENLGPVNLSDAPVLLTLGPDNYWVFGRYRPDRSTNFNPESASLPGFDIPLQTTPFTNQYDAPGGLKPKLGGYHAWQSKDMVNWVHHGPITEKKSAWMTTAEYYDGKAYFYYDFPNDQDPHVYVDSNLFDGLPGENKGMAYDDPTHGSDCAIIRDLEGKFHLIVEDWSPINAQRHAWDSSLAVHAVSSNGISGFQTLSPPVDERTHPTGKVGTYTHPHWVKEHPERFKTNIAEYEIHEPEQNAYGDWAAISIGGQYYLFCDYDAAQSKVMQVGWFTSPSLDQQFTWCDSIGKGHPDPDVTYAEDQFYLITQQDNDFVSPGPWVESVEARVGVDTVNDGDIDQWTNWTDVKETYDYISGFSKQVRRIPAQMDVSSLPEGYGFQIELKMTDTTENKSKPMIESISLTLEDQ